MKEELDEKDFIHEGIQKNPYPLWIWAFILFLILCLFWNYGNFADKHHTTSSNLTPFSNVTNRQLSVFLWQHPEFMRVNKKNVFGYLPGFSSKDKIRVIPKMADEIVKAPPETLFAYHTWNRLIGVYTFPRPITVPEFRLFLRQQVEWHPRSWSSAPQSFVDMVESVEKKEVSALQFEALPFEIQQAYIGWKNYFFEGDQINEVKVTYRELTSFLSSHPHYRRHYWQNILKKELPDYLKSLDSDNFQPDDPYPDRELAPFLKVALWNALRA